MYTVSYTGYCGPVNIRCKTFQMALAIWADVLLAEGETTLVPAAADGVADDDYCPF